MEQYRVSSSVIADTLNMVSDAVNGLKSAEASLESAGYRLEREEKRLGKLVFPLEGRESFDKPINLELAKTNSAVLDLIDAERVAAVDKQDTYLRAIKFIRSALEELEE